MHILLIWDEVPEQTWFHIIPFDEKYLKLHGRFVGAIDCSDEEATLIAEVERIKGASLMTCELTGQNVSHFVHTGVLL